MKEARTCPAHGFAAASSRARKNCTKRAQKIVGVRAARGHAVLTERSRSPGTAEAVLAPVVEREALLRIAVDEERHAELAWRVLAWAAGRDARVLGTLEEERAAVAPTYAASRVVFSSSGVRGPVAALVRVASVGDDLVVSFLVVVPRSCAPAGTVSASPSATDRVIVIRAVERSPSKKRT